MDSSSAYGDLTPVDRDALIRTTLGEAGTDPISQPGVASTVLNRMRASGQSAIQTVLAPHQFEAWSARPKELLGYSADSADYQRVGKMVDDLASGAIPDPVNGATNYYAPAAQAALGRAPPAWDDGSGIDLGKHRFFGGTKTAAAAPTNFLTDFALASPTGEQSAPPSSQVSPSPSPAADTGEGVSFATPEQMAALKAAAPTTAPSASPTFLTDFPLSTPGAPTPAAPASPAPATPIGVNDSVRAIATGVPIVGGLANDLDARLNATLAPALNRFFAPQDQLQGDSWGDRYGNALQQQQGMDTAFAQQHPTASNALQIGGAVLGTAAGMRQVPAAFGVTNAGVVPNMVLGGLGGGAIGGADAAVRSNGDLSAIERGAGLGGAFGALGPALGAGIGYGVNKLSNALARTTPAARTAANALSGIGVTPDAARNALADIGPQATLADVDPALTGHARGLAQLGGEPTSVLKNAYAARAAGADSRATDLMERELGPKPDLNGSIASIEDDAAARAGPYYQAGRAGASMDVTPVLRTIDTQIPNASGGSLSVLKSAKNFLTRNAPTSDSMGMLVPKDDPGAVLSARQAMDDMMYSRETGEAKLGPNAMRVAQDIRGQLDGIVKSNGSFAAGDAIHSQAMGIRAAMQRGTDVFKSNLRPEDLQRTLQSMTPEELQAYQSGARVAIGDAMEQSRRGELAAAQSLFSKGSANRAKLEAIFPNAQNVFDALHGEVTMRATERAVLSGSATAENQAIRTLYAPKGAHPLEAAPAIIGDAIAGGGGAVGLSALKAGWNALANYASEGARSRLTGDMARGLSATGAGQNAFLGQIARASRTTAATNALAQAANRSTNLLTHVSGNALQHYLPAYQR